VTLLRYATLVTGAVVIPLPLLAFLWGDDPHALRSAAFGGSVAALNALGAYATLSWAQLRRTNVFLGAIVASMLGRMAFVLAAVVVGLGSLDLRRIPMVAALLGYFVVFLLLEIKSLPRTVGAEARARS
jgi:hypothetical protein